MGQGGTWCPGISHAFQHQNSGLPGLQCLCAGGHPPPPPRCILPQVAAPWLLRLWKVPERYFLALGRSSQILIPSLGSEQENPHLWGVNFLPQEAVENTSSPFWSLSLFHMDSPITHKHRHSFGASHSSSPHDCSYRRDCLRESQGPGSSS